jgi:AcrR family transcriptional regulator
VPRAGLNAQVLTLSAAELADEEGLAEVTLAALARRFHVKAPSLYVRISSSRDLKQRVAVLALAETADRVGEAVAGRSGRDALDALGRGYRDYAAAHPGRHEVTILPLDDGVARASAVPRHTQRADAVLRSLALAEPEETNAVRLLGATVRTDGRSGRGAGGLPVRRAVARRARRKRPCWSRRYLRTSWTYWPTRSEG